MQILRRVLAVFLLTAASAATAAEAQAQGLDAERFAPAVGVEPGFAFEHPMVPFHLGWGLGLFLDVADDPVVVRDDATGDILARPLDTAVTLDLLGTIGFFGWSELGVHLPVQVVYEGDDFAGLSASGGVGNLRLVPKFLLLRTGTLASHFLLGAAVPVSFPTGDEAALRGAGGVTVEPRLMAAWHGESVGLGVNVGYRWRSEHPAALPWGDELYLALMAQVGISDTVAFQAEVFGGKQMGTDVDGADFPFEGLAGIWWRVTPNVAVHVAGGPGFTDGIGNPDFRVVGGVRFQSGTPGGHGFRDEDQDGIADKDDDCPEDAEDFDGFKDEDGCPELDNDDDGIMDETDECPELPEEQGGDGDGCPSKTYVKVVGGEMQIFGKVLFKTGSNELDPKSDGLLDQIAVALEANPQVKHLRIEGHTDSQGDDELNQRLSEGRANSVKTALVKRGVDEDRLETRGHGESKPTAPNETAAGRAKNRRVEFKIVEDGQ